MTQRFFITGTDTEIGKTFSTCVLSRAFVKRGYRVANFKPIAAGAERIDGEWKNDDALLLQQAHNHSLSYRQINPFCFAEAIAPHIAAAKNNTRLTVAKVTQALSLESIDSDIMLIEGAGGWMVPLNEESFFSDLPKALDCSVILVVGMRLGCINHALLSQAQIIQQNNRLAGWIANQIDPNMQAYQDNLTILKKHMSAPLIGEIPFCPDNPTKLDFADENINLLLKPDTLFSD